MDQEPPPYSTDSRLYTATGLQGYEPEGVQTLQPQQQPTGQALTAEQNEHHRLISSMRMVIEPIMAGMKRCRMVKALCRNTQATSDDLVMEIACALHNFRVDCRQS